MASLSVGGGFHGTAQGAPHAEIMLCESQMVLRLCEVQALVYYDPTLGNVVPLDIRRDETVQAEIIRKRHEQASQHLQLVIRSYLIHDCVKTVGGGQLTCHSFAYIAQLTIRTDGVKETMSTSMVLCGTYIRYVRRDVVVEGVMEKRGEDSQRCSMGIIQCAGLVKRIGWTLKMNRKARALHPPLRTTIADVSGTLHRKKQHQNAEIDISPRPFFRHSLGVTEDPGGVLDHQRNNKNVI
ncbi:hypothetical protein BDW22DRAFT_1349478 [Trametopsis cervina]|nr:hypothetical protein BDW22DRAFT_1349478 [Trametopsis cervina]